MHGATGLWFMVPSMYAPARYKVIFKDTQGYAGTQGWVEEVQSTTQYQIYALLEN